MVSLPKKVILCLSLALSLAGCSGLSPLGLLSGGPSATAVGTNFAKEVQQKVVAQETTTSAGRDVITTETLSEADVVEQQTITNNQIPPWVVLLALLGWVLPTPSQMGLAIWSALTMPFRRRP